MIRLLLTSSIHSIFTKPDSPNTQQEKLLKSKKSNYAFLPSSIYTYPAWSTGQITLTKGGSYGNLS